MLKNKYLIFILIIPFFLSSCTDTNIVSNFNDGGIESNKIILTPEEFVSIAYDDPKELTEEEISNIVLDFRNNIEVGKEVATRNSEKLKISIEKKYYITEDNNGIETVATTRSPILEELTVPIFEVELFGYDGRKSLAVVCGDEREPEVLFYAENYRPSSVIDNQMRYLLELSKKNILSDIQQIEHLKSTRRDSTLYKIAQQLNMPKGGISYLAIKDRIVTTDEIITRNNNPGNQTGGESRPNSNVVGFVNPLSKVAWDQHYPYNYSMPKMWIFDDHAGEYEGNIVVGCANTAVGILFSIVKPYMSLSNGKRIDWDYVTAVEEIYGIPEYPEYSSPQELIDMISGMLAQIATATGSTPFYEEKKLIDINTGKTYIKSVITQTTTPTVNTINYLRSMVNFSGDIKNKFNGNQAKQSLFERKPVFLCGSGHIVDNNGKIIRKGGGHAWLIDGVVITKRPRQSGHDHYWSVNMGWGADKRVYFRTSNDLQDCDVVFPTGTKNENYAYYTREMTMLYNVTSK